jgi:hypothetical protein
MVRLKGAGQHYKSIPKFVASSTILSSALAIPPCCCCFGFKYDRRIRFIWNWPALGGGDANIVALSVGMVAVIGLGWGVLLNEPERQSAIAFMKKQFSKVGSDSN